MPRAEQPGEKQIEIWETMTGGAVFVWTYDRRNDRYEKTRVGGRSGSRRLQITVDDRIYNQEQVVVENKHLDPFTNGTLRRLSGPTIADDEDGAIDATYHLTNEDLVELLQVRDEDLFKGEVADIKSELLLRRLLEVAEKDGVGWQHEFVRELIRERHPVGGTQKTVREMMAAGEVQGGTPLSSLGG